MANILRFVALSLPVQRRNSQTRDFQRILPFLKGQRGARQQRMAGEGPDGAGPRLPKFPGTA
jgi:hypothetical protein